MESRIYVLAFFCGILLETLVFSRNEWDRRAPNISISFSLLFAGTYITLAVGFGLSYAKSFLETYLLGSSLIAGLFSSIVTYRLLLHPLRSFPGPLFARMSSFWVIKENTPDLQFYRKLRKLHGQYGDFVRIRPREISICHPDAVLDVHGPKNKIRKGEFYEQTYPYYSVQLTRDANYHRNQRRYWDRAFQSKALQEYTPRLVKHYTILMEVLSQHAASGTSADASHLFLNLFFDVISDLTFGKSFNSLTTERNVVMKGFLNQQKYFGYIFMSIWVFHLARTFLIAQRIIKDSLGSYRRGRTGKSHSGLSTDHRNRVSEKKRWYIDALEERKKLNTISPDIYTYLSQSEEFEANSTQELNLAIVAGGDTNAITLSNICYLLCRHPEYQKKLYRELSDLPKTPEGFIDERHLVDKHYLLGTINEALRLHPPVPTGLQRLTPPEGAVIAGRFIPGEMVVTTPTYSLHRDPRAFVVPDSFIPERWSSEPELILRKDAFIPFGYGAYNCAGKPLAMMQLRMVTAMIIQRFEISFSPGKEGECRHFSENQGDCFTLHLEPLPLLVKERNVSS